MYSVIMNMVVLVIAFLCMIAEMKRDWPVLPVGKNLEYWKEFQRGNKWLLHFAISRMGLLIFVAECMFLFVVFCYNMPI